MTSPQSTSHALRMSYRIGRGEQGVLTFEPYKSTLLPLWRFRTVEVARKSSQDLWERFEAYDEEGDFVGMDMCRKFIQMVSSAPHRRQSWFDIEVAGHDASKALRQPPRRTQIRCTRRQGAAKELDAQGRQGKDGSLGCLPPSLESLPRARGVPEAQGRISQGSARVG